MFSNILKWTFKTIKDGVEKEFDLHLANDTSTDEIEQIAVQMISHCAKVKELQAAQQQSQKATEAPTENPCCESTCTSPEGNQHV